MKPTGSAAGDGITPEVVSAHGLTEEEYGRLLDLLGREPNLTELGIFSVMWSEHCSYKSSRRFLSGLPTEGPAVLQGPGENAGAVEIEPGLAVVFKMESHNHPSFIEPYQGAATGVGGILRDIFTMGARPIASIDSLRFGEIDHPRTRYLVDGVVSGIAGYGNCMGVPTVGGEAFFDARYSENILVNVFNLGVVPSNRIFRARASGVGNRVIYVGSKTGRDGIHGATMASAEFDEDSEEKRPTVQVGDPFTEKLLLESCLEIMREGAVVAIQDMGAAGLTCSTVEMAARGGVGIELDLDRVPRREEGMTPYEIMLSESQERMLLVVEPEKEEAALRVYQKWDLDAVVVGHVTEGDRLIVRAGGRVAVDVPIKPLAEDAPCYDRPRKEPSDLRERWRLDTDALAPPGDLGETLLRLLASPNIASREWIYRQYDHTVRTNSVVCPGGDAAVVRLKESSAAVAITVQGNGRLCWLDPYRGAQLSFIEATRNLACVGAEPIGITDCLNFGNPERPEILWEFERAVAGLADAARRYGVPVVSGNVSFYNESNGSAVYPTPTIGVVGKIADAGSALTPGFKAAGDRIWLLGENRGEIAGSEYLHAIHGRVCGRPPAADLDRSRAVELACRRAVAKRLLASAHDCSDGGLAVALAEECFPRGLGADIRLEDRLRPDLLLFGEEPSRIVVSCAEENAGALLAIAAESRAPIVEIGRIGGERLSIGQPGTGLIDRPVAELRAAWSAGLADALEGPGSAQG